MKLDFISVFVSFAALSFITSVLCQGKSRRMPIEGSGSGVGPGIDDEDQAASSLPGYPRKPPPPINRKASSPSDRRIFRERDPSRSPLPERRWPPTEQGPSSSLKRQRVMGPTLPSKQLGVANKPSIQQGDEGSGQLPPDQERPAAKTPTKGYDGSGSPLDMKKRQPFGKSGGGLTLEEAPVSCFEARRRGFNQYFDPVCDEDGRYRRLQCKQKLGDCMCVDPDTGMVFSATVTLKEKKISCEEVKYIIQLPLRTHQRPMKTVVTQIKNQLTKLMENLTGLQKLNFVRYLPEGMSRVSSMEFSCVSIGHNSTGALRPFLAGLLEKHKIHPRLSDDKSLLNVTLVSNSRAVGRPPHEPRDTPAVKPPDNGSPGKNTREQYNAGEDRPSARDDSNAPPNDEGKNAASMGQNKKSGAAAFLQQPGIIAAIIGGGIAGFFLAILLILFCIYRIRKKDEGSYALEEPKKMPVSAAVYHSAPTREYYA